MATNMYRVGGEKIFFHTRFSIIFRYRRRLTVSPGRLVCVCVYVCGTPN